MTDWQRLEQIIRWTGLSTNAFAFSIGLKRSQNLYQIKRHRNRISKDLADRIVRRYPVFDRSWLLTGDGPSPDRKVASGLWLDPPSGSDQPPLGLRRDRIRHLYLVQGIVIRKVL